MYATLISSIENLFASATWTAANIAIYPDNYQGTISDQNEFCRLNILPASGTTQDHNGKKTLSGTVIVTMYVKAGEGQRRVAAIADTLDSLLEHKYPTSGLGLGASFVTIGGLDSQNSALYTAQYIIPFTYYED
jgi:hypothetical protein